MGQLAAGYGGGQGVGNYPVMTFKFEWLVELVKLAVPFINRTAKSQPGKRWEGKETKNTHLLIRSRDGVEIRYSKRWERER